jgi:hypothetical protein
MTMDRLKIIELLDQSFQTLPDLAKLQLLLELNLPRVNPRTQTEFVSFAEILYASCNFTLVILVEEFQFRNLLKPESCG